MTFAQSPLKVLHLRDSPWIDGPGRTILETASHIDRARIDYHVGVFVPARGHAHPLLVALRQRGVPAHEIIDDGKSVRKIATQVSQLIDALEIDILHTSEFRSNVVALLSRQGRAIRLISTAHGWIANDLWGKWKVFSDRCLKRHFDHVILVSRAMRGRLPEWWIPDNRVSVLHNALIQERFGSAAHGTSRRVAGSGGEIRLLNVGRLSVEKGQSLLLEALAELAPNYPGIRLDFAGIGPLGDRLASEARELGIADRVRFIGFVEDMTEIYASSDLVIQASFTEGLPNVVLEAGYLGLPILATDVGGTSEVIKHGVTGWLIQPCSVRALVNGIRQFLEEPDRFRAMAQAASATIEREFSFAERTKEQERIYERVGGRTA